MSAQARRPEESAEEPRAPQKASRQETVENLELRLIDGYHRIDVARDRGDDITAWEDFWIGLLHRYEALCDDVRVAA